MANISDVIWEDLTAALGDDRGKLRCAEVTFSNGTKLSLDYPRLTITQSTDSSMTVFYGVDTIERALIAELAIAQEKLKKNQEVMVEMVKTLKESVGVIETLSGIATERDALQKEIIQLKKDNASLRRFNGE